MRIKRGISVFLIAAIALMCVIGALHLSHGCADEDCPMCLCLRTVRMLVISSAAVRIAFVISASKGHDFSAALRLSAQNPTLYALKTELLD